ncbi:hypothetical protein O181_061948 [Austropuccinia psidii MF-1]|uniref:Uncharacterized protein n=1 Tax=Austropuccinia psidii MF-1 TaxID=1389203 RepID=A0A9Q3HZ22_9BASI|nr:hypothetical protein [Austropuccinia psidii MF-1]
MHFFNSEGSVHTVLGTPCLAENNIKLESFHKYGEILSYQEPDRRILCIPLCKPQAIGWQTGPPREIALCIMAKLVINTPRKKLQNAKQENTMIKLTQRTQELCISPNHDEFNPKLGNIKWTENLKQQPEYPSSSNESPKMIYKTITNNSKPARSWWMEIRKSM